MPGYPHKDADARTGSTLPGEPLRALFGHELRNDAASHAKLARDYLRQYGKLFPKKDTRLLSRVAQEVIAEWRQDIVEAAPDSGRIAELTAAARRKLDRSFGRALPNMARAKALRRSQLREHARLSAAAHAGFTGAQHHIDIGDVTATLTDCAEFFPPFTSFEVDSVAGPGDFIVRDDSFVKPQIGHLVNNFDYDQNENTSFSAGLWGLLTHAFGSNSAALGVAFTTPRDGRIEVHAVMRNFYNKVMFAVTDKFGFSDAEVDIFLQLFITIVRGTKVILMPTTLRHTGLVSHGSDLSFHESDIDNSASLTISGATDQRFNANESVLVLAGSRVLVTTVIDDMHCKVNAVLWWQLQKLCVGMAEDIFT